MEESSSIASRKRLKKNLVVGLVTTVVCLVVKVHFTAKIERRLIYLYLQFLKAEI